MIPGLIHGGMPMGGVGIWELISSTEATNGNSTTNFPSGIQDGDHAVIAISAFNASSFASASLSGWTGILSTSRTIGNEENPRNATEIVAHRALTAANSGANLGLSTTHSHSYRLYIFRRTKSSPTPSYTALITGGTGNMSSTAFSGAAAPPIAVYAFSRSNLNTTTFTPSGGSGTWYSDQRSAASSAARCGIAVQAQLVPANASCSLTDDATITRRAGYIIG